MTGLSLVSTFVKRWVAPLQQRPSLMHEYTGLEDPSRLNRLTWSVEDFIAQIGRLTGYVLEDKNVPGLAAYRSSKPVPTVSRLAMFVFLFIISFRILNCCCSQTFWHLVGLPPVREDAPQHRAGSQDVGDGDC